MATGKIARMPRSIRDKVNLNLEDGKTARQIMAWLNADPNVKAVLDLEFDGQAVTENNVSEWRRGGFQRWQRDRRSDELIQEVIQMQQDEADTLQMGLTDKMHLLYIGHMFADIRNLDHLHTTAARFQLWREMRLGIVAMRRYQFDTLRLKELQGQKPKVLTEEEKEETVRRIFGFSEDLPRMNKETGRFEGPNCDPLNEQRDRLLAELARKQLPETEADLLIKQGPMAVNAWYNTYAEQEEQDRRARYGVKDTLE